VAENERTPDWRACPDDGIESLSSSERGRRRLSLPRTDPHGNETPNGDDAIDFARDADKA
jgi:hypothetical protein